MKARKFKLDELVLFFYPSCSSPLKLMLRERIAFKFLLLLALSCSLVK